MAGGPRAALRRAGGAPRGPRRRPVHGRDVLRPRRARHRDRRGAVGLEPADRRDDDLRRGRRDDRRRRRGRRGRRGSRELESAAIGTNHGAGPHSALSALQAMGDGSAARSDAEHRPRQHVRRPDHLPARRARVLRRVRRARTGARRQGDRRLLRHDADRDRRDPAGDRRGAGAARAARSRRARARRGDRARRPRDAARGRPARGPVRHVDPDRPAARRELRGPARGRGRGARLRARRLRRRQRQRDRSGRHEPADRLGGDRAAVRDRDDPAPDARATRR